MSASGVPGGTEDEGRGYLKAADTDALARMVFELLSELWIARDRIAVVEQLLTDAGVLPAGEVDRFEPAGHFAARLETMRDLMAANVLSAPFRQEHTVESLIALGRERCGLLAK